MNPALFLLVLRARFGLFLLAVCLTVVAAAAVTLIMPKTYRATASMVVDGRESQSLSSTLNTYVSQTERSSWLQTQVEIINSPKVARRVVDDLQLAERPEAREAYATEDTGDIAIEDWLAAQLKSGLEVETSQSSIVHVIFSSPDPADAAALANGFARAYMHTALELQVEPSRQAAAWFNEQLETLRKDLEAAQQKLTEYQREHGIVSTAEGVDDEYAMLENLSAQMLRSMEENVDLATREQLAQQAISSGAALDAVPVIREDDSVRELRADLRKGEAALQALSVRYGENHPEYRKQRAENASMRAALDAEMRKVAGLASNQRVAGEQRAARIRATLAAQRARVLDLKEGRDGLAVLLRNVSTAQAAYDTAMERSVVNQVDSRADRAGATLLTPAVAPRVPHSPNLILNLALAVMVGVMLGLGLVLLREMTDRRVHSPIELAEATGAPVLGELIAWSPPGRMALPAPRGPARRSPAHIGRG